MAGGTVMRPCLKQHWDMDMQCSVAPSGSGLDLGWRSPVASSCIVWLWLVLLVGGVEGVVLVLGRVVVRPLAGVRRGVGKIACDGGAVVWWVGFLVAGCVTNRETTYIHLLSQATVESLISYVANMGISRMNVKFVPARAIHPPERKNSGNEDTASLNRDISSTLA